MAACIKRTPAKLSHGLCIETGARCRKKDGEIRALELCAVLRNEFRKLLGSASVFSEEELLNYYSQCFRPTVRKLVAQKIRWIPFEESVKLSALRPTTAAIGNSQRALMKESEKMESKARASEDEKENAKRLGANTVILTPPAQVMDESMSNGG